MARKVRYLPPSARGRVFSRNRPPRPVVPKAEVVAPVVEIVEEEVVEAPVVEVAEVVVAPSAAKIAEVEVPVVEEEIVEAPEEEAPEVEEEIVEEEAPEVEEEIVEEEVAVLVRARDEDGHFQSDDPTTPDVNEAYEEASPEPLWDAKMNKATLLKVALGLGLEDLSRDSRKWEIVNALKAATS